jgi:hypothetical protein
MSLSARINEKDKEDVKISFPKTKNKKENKNVKIKPPKSIRLSEIFFLHSTIV